MIKKSKEYILYAGLMVLGAVLGLLKLMYLAQKVSVSDFGSFSIVVLFAGYVIYLNSFGLDSAFYRNGSFFFGQKKVKRIRYQLIHFFSAISLLGALFILLSFLLCYPFNITIKVVYIVLLSLGMVLFNIFTTYARILQKTILFASLLFLRNLIAFSLIALTVVYQNIDIIIIGEILSYFLVIIFLIFKYRIVWVKPNLKFIRQQAKDGVPFSSANLLNNLTLNLDQWFISFYYGEIILGFYSFLMIAFSIGKSVLNIISQALIPKIISNYAVELNKSKLLQKVESISIKIALGGIIIGFGGYFVAKFGIENYYDKYVEVIYLLPAILLATILYISNFYSIFLFTLNFGKLEFRIKMFLLAFSFSMCVIGVIYDFGLAYYVYVFLAQRVLSLLSYKVIVDKQLKSSLSKES